MYCSNRLRLVVLDVAKRIALESSYNAFDDFAFLLCHYIFFLIQQFDISGFLQGCGISISPTKDFQ
jgi:hypothetical protein